MVEIPAFRFEQDNLLAELAHAPDSEVDTFQFGVIGFDADTVVRRYSAFESKMSGLTMSKVIG